MGIEVVAAGAIVAQMAQYQSIAKPKRKVDCQCHNCGGSMMIGENTCWYCKANFYDTRPTITDVLYGYCPVYPENHVKIRG